MACYLENEPIHDSRRPCYCGEFSHIPAQRYTGSTLVQTIWAGSTFLGLVGAACERRGRLVCEPRYGYDERWPCIRGRCGSLLE